MVDPIDDIFQQAHQGSVAAIVQVLNKNLASTGVRTRAIFASGVLQLLCEASRVEKLEQSLIVDRIGQILESIAPRHIHRVKINSRLVQEQQLLWLEDLSENPDRLLWSQEIEIVKPNIFQQLMKRKNRGATKSSKPPLPTKSPSQLDREKQGSQLAFMQGVSLTLFLMLVSMSLYSWLEPKFATTRPVQILEAPTSQEVSATAKEPILSTAIAESEDPFAEAVRIAQKAAIAGQVADSSAEWLDLAVQWQRASDLMGAVPPEHEQYEIARDRQLRYLQNSEVALKEAERRRS